MPAPAELFLVELRCDPRTPWARFRAANGSTVQHVRDAGLFTAEEAAALAQRGDQVLPALELIDLEILWHQSSLQALTELRARCTSTPPPSPASDADGVQSAWNEVVRLARRRTETAPRLLPALTRLHQALGLPWEAP